MGIVIGLLVGRQTSTKQTNKCKLSCVKYLLVCGKWFLSSYMGMANAEKAKENSN